MRCSHSELARIADRHRRSIEARGYAVERRLAYPSDPFRRLWRALSRSTWEGFRTYWRARSRTGAPLFIKVYFGNLDPRVSLLDAENECLLHAHFTRLLPPGRDVRQIALVDAWRGDSFACVAHEWLDIAPIQVLNALLERRTRAGLAALLEMLTHAPAPSGWSGEREGHNYAFTDHATLDHETARAFDLDLPLNLGIDSAGQLVFHDFEKFQWSTPGLQGAHLALWVELGCRREGRATPTVELAEVLRCFDSGKLAAAIPRCRPIIGHQLRSKRQPEPSEVEWTMLARQVEAHFSSSPAVPAPADLAIPNHDSTHPEPFT